MYLIAMVSAIVVYVVVSLMTCRADFDLNRMLRRDSAAPVRRRLTFGALLGFDENFSRADKFVSGGLFAWGMFWFAVCIGGTIWNLVSPWPVSWWARYWRVAAVLLPLVIGAATAVWFTWGGVRDLRRLFQNLRSLERDAHDDGTVTKP
jgi:SSS family solute:Na+ symporter